jgi:hypothetical protein
MLKQQIAKWFWFLFTLQVLCFGINIVSLIIAWHRQGTPFHVLIFALWFFWGYLLYSQIQKRRELRLAQIELALDGMMNSTLPSYTFSSGIFSPGIGSSTTIRIPGTGPVTLQNGQSLIVDIDSKGNVTTKVVP